jgi:hypothetical protein
MNKLSVLWLHIGSLKPRVPVSMKQLAETLESALHRYHKLGQVCAEAFANGTHRQLLS